MRHAALPWLLALAACTAPPAVQQPGEQQLVIYGGSEPDRPEHEAVVALHDRYADDISDSPFCTGTLIGDRLVLTAAHCTEGTDADELAIYVGDVPAEDPAFDDHVYDVEEVIVHEGYDDWALVNDISLLRLAGSPDATDERVAPLPGLFALTEDDIGTIMNFAGFGYDEDRDFGRKLQVDVPLGGLGCSVEGCSRPGDPATQISYTQPDGGPCNGDSGGPMFVYRDGVPYVGGITSYGDYACTGYGVSTKVDAYGAWIDGHAGPTPVRPGELVINEVMVNAAGPDNATGGDPEWVEIVNPGEAPVSLDGWTLYDGWGERHAFEPGAIGPGEALVLEGRLYLNNRGGDELALVDPDGAERDLVSWDGTVPDGISLTRAVDGDPDAELVEHDTLPAAGGAIASPGTRVDGSPF